jgi:hypothetical protein
LPRTAGERGGKGAEHRRRWRRRREEAEKNKRSEKATERKGEGEVAATVTSARRDLAATVTSAHRDLAATVTFAATVTLMLTGGQADRLDRRTDRHMCLLAQRHAASELHSAVHKLWACECTRASALDPHAPAPAPVRTDVHVRSSTRVACVHLRQGAYARVLDTYPT